MTIDPDDASTWTPHQLKEFILKSVSDRLRTFAGKHNTEDVRAELCAALASYGTTPEKPCFELVDYKECENGIIEYTVRDNRPRVTTEFEVVPSEERNKV